MAGSIRDASAHAPFVRSGESRHVDLLVLMLGAARVLPHLQVHGLVVHILPQPNKVSTGWLRLGGEMLLKMALALLMAWLIGVLGVYNIGDAVHVLLLMGGMLLLLGVLKARDAAAAAARDANDPSRKP